MFRRTEATTTGNGGREKVVESQHLALRFLSHTVAQKTRNGTGTRDGTFGPRENSVPATVGRTKKGSGRPLRRYRYCGAAAGHDDRLSTEPRAYREFGRNARNADDRIAKHDGW